MPFGVSLCGLVFIAFFQSARSSVVRPIEFGAHPNSSQRVARHHPSSNSDQERLYLTETIYRTYYATIGIGTPAQYLRLLFHTGISDIWVHECLSDYKADCILRKSYRPRHSTTASKERSFKQFETSFYPEVLLSGHMAMDDVVVGSKHIVNQSFATYDEVFYTSAEPHPMPQIDGFFGVGHPAGSVIMKDQFFLNMLQQKLITEPLLSIYLRKQGGGELILGAVDSTQHITQHKWVSTSNDKGAWNLQVEDVYMFSVMNACNDWCQATLTTGTSRIAGPPTEIAEINGYLQSSFKNKPSKRNQPCTERVYSIVEEFFDQRHETTSNAQMCLSIGLCERSQISNMAPLSLLRLLEHNVSDFQHSFGCAACLSISDLVQGMHALEDYNADFGSTLCNWLDEGDMSAVEEQDTAEVDCSSIENFRFLRFRIDGAYFYVDSPDYIYKRVHSNLVMTCHTEFVPYYSSEGNKWILGTSFLRAFHTVIDYKSRKIGFASPATEI